MPSGALRQGAELYEGQSLIWWSNQKKDLWKKFWLNKNIFFSELNNVHFVGDQLDKLQMIRGTIFHFTFKSYNLFFFFPGRAMPLRQPSTTSWPSCRWTFMSSSTEWPTSTLSLSSSYRWDGHQGKSCCVRGCPAKEGWLVFRVGGCLAGCLGSLLQPF